MSKLHSRAFVSLLAVSSLFVGQSGYAQTNESEPGPMRACEDGTKPSVPITIEFELSARSFAPSDAIDLEIAAGLYGSASSATLTVRGVGGWAGVNVERHFEGPWTRFPTDHRLNFRAPALAAGAFDRSYLEAELVAEGPNGKRLFSRLTRLHGWNDGETTWVSPSSPTDLAQTRQAALAKRGKLTREELDVANVEIVTARPKTDTTPITREEPSEAAKRFQREYDALAGPMRTIETAPPSGAERKAPYLITGRIRFTDKEGNVHGVPMATIELWDDDDPLGDELVATFPTDARGFFAYNIDHDDGIGQGNPDFYIRVFAKSRVHDLKPMGAMAETYRMESAVQNEVSSSTVIFSMTAGNTADAETVFSVHSGLVTAGTYAGQLAGTMPSTVTVRFPTTRSTSLFDPGMGELHILQLDRFDWDVVGHEYGHYFMNGHGFVDNPGGRHASGANLSLPAYTGSKDPAVRLAWGEGWPTHFAIIGQVALGTASIGMKNVGDRSYTDTEDSTVDNDLEAAVGVGEDDELSVMCTLWDIADTANDGLDKWTQSDRSIFTALKSSGSKIMGDAWNALAAGKSPRDKASLGGIFGDHKIAPELMMPMDEYEAMGATIPTFTWVKNGGGAPNPLDDFQIRFYGDNFGVPGAMPLFMKDVGDVASWTPTQPEWDMILSEGRAHWVVLGRDTDAMKPTPVGAEMYYWSAARTLGGGIRISFVIDDTGSMGGEIDAVKSALQSFIDLVDALLEPDETPPVIQVVSFKDSVSERLVSNDLDAVRSTVASLFASGGGDCPEYGAQALAYAANTISPDSIILFATDAPTQPGVDIGALISLLQSKRITVHTMLTQGCGTSRLPGEPVASARNANSNFENGYEVAETQAPGAGDGDVSALGKPDDDEDDPAQGYVPDPGQAPIDDFGDSVEFATPLALGADPLNGTVSTSEPGDYFVFNALTGQEISVRTQHDNSTPGSLNAYVYDPMGAYVDNIFLFGGRAEIMPFVASMDGDYSVVVTGTSSALTGYSIAAGIDPFAFLENKTEMFSTISLQSGGAFSWQSSFNASAYTTALFNIMAGSVRPAIIVSTPDILYQDTSVSINLTGNRTNWTSASMLRFEDTSTGAPVPEVTVDSLIVTSATTAIARVSASASAPMTSLDPIIETSVGGMTEVARGVGSLRVSSAPVSPTLLGVSPDHITQGQSLDLTFSGAQTSWDSTSTVDLGPDIVVNAINAVSATELVVSVTVGAGASIGWVSPTVTTGAISSEFKYQALLVGSALAAFPKIASITPTEIARGSTMDIMVTGEAVHFVNGATSADFGLGIDVLDVQVIAADTAICTVYARIDATLAFRTVILQTGSENASLVSGLFVRDFDSVNPLAAGGGKISDCLDAYGLAVHEFSVAAPTTIERLFIKPMGDASETAFIGPTFLEVHLEHPGGMDEILHYAAGSDAINLTSIALPAAGTYRLILRDNNNAGGCFKGKLSIN